ncbi:MAG: hypothetical protein ACYDGR_00675 [Candidatus Dormibacteria bacterium]
MSDKGGARSGQTLLVFALTAGLVMVALLALVGDNAVLQVHYNRIDEAALLAVQAAASDIDIPAFASTHIVRLADDAERVCHQVAVANAPASAVPSCFVPADRSYVRAEVVDTGALPVRLFGPGFLVRATHVGRPVYGVNAPCTDPRDPSTCR